MGSHVLHFSLPNTILCFTCLIPLTVLPHHAHYYFVPLPATIVTCAHIWDSVGEHYYSTCTLDFPTHTYCSDLPTCVLLPHLYPQHLHIPPAHHIPAMPGSWAPPTSYHATHFTTEVPPPPCLPPFVLPPVPSIPAYLPYCHSHSPPTYH